MMLFAFEDFSFGFLVSVFHRKIFNGHHCISSKEKCICTVLEYDDADFKENYG